MEDITIVDYTLAKRVCEDFEIKNLGAYHDFLFKVISLLLADAFENFTDMCLEIYELDPAKFSSASRLPWLAA